MSDCIAIIDWNANFKSNFSAMASLTIRNLEEPIKELIRIRAAHHGHSMEEEVR